jgi:hypothetical protein
MKGPSFLVRATCLSVLLLVLSVGFAVTDRLAAAAQPGQQPAILTQVADFLKKWRPMSKTLRGSYPEIRVIVAHRMTKEQIRQCLDKSVVIDDRDPSGKTWYIPVMPSQGFDLHFDASGRLLKVDAVGAPVTFNIPVAEEASSL